MLVNGWIDVAKMDVAVTQSHCVRFAPKGLAVAHAANITHRDIKGFLDYLGILPFFIGFQVSGLSGVSAVIFKFL